MYNNKELAAKGLAELGPISRREIVLAVLFVLAILGYRYDNQARCDCCCRLLFGCRFSRRSSDLG